MLDLSLHAALLAVSLFSSPVYTQTLADGTSIAQCPSDETSYPPDSSTTQFLLCPGSDYVGASAAIHDDIPNASACASLCAETEGCAKAVFDLVNLVCHVKAEEPQASLFWRANARFTTIRTPLTQNPGIVGRWSDLIRLPVIPVAAYMVPESDLLLYFSSFGNDTFSGPTGKTQFGELNLTSLTSTHREVANTQHDMFCPAISMLQDGRSVIQGGSDAEAVSIYSPSTHTFTRGTDMVVARGYQTSTTLSNGKIFTIGGAFSGERVGKDGEIFDPETGEWTFLEDADVTPMLTTDREGIWREDNHAWLVGWKNGSVFQAGPSMQQHWYGTEGSGSVVAAGTRDAIDDAMCGVWALYDAVAGKIFSGLGSPDYTDSPGIRRAHITTIGEPFEPAQVERVSDPGFPRGFANAVVLPDGAILVTGGQRRSLVFTDTDGTLIAELYDPQTDEWKQLAAEAVPRNYHAVAILLPDATVFSGGGGLCYVGNPGDSTAHCDRSVDHADGQIFSPPYLFNEDGSEAERPVISDLAETSVQAGDELLFSITGEDNTYSLVRLGSVTHSVNSDQRRVPLLDFVEENGQVTVQLPSDYGILLPGYYYLFAMSSQGTPSIGKSVQVML